MDVRDAVTALDLLSSTPDSVGEVINVGVDNEITVTELAELVKRITGKQSNITYTPYQEAYGEGYDEIYHRRPSLKKLNRLITFCPKWTLEKTIEDLMKRERGEINSLIREKQDVFPIR
jgi:UDP-glucose 4-epimerase